MPTWPRMNSQTKQPNRQMTVQPTMQNPTSLSPPSMRSHREIQEENGRGHGIGSDSVLHELFPAIPKLVYKSLDHRHAESKLIWVLSGHSRLNNHMHRLGLADDPCCECGPARQTVSHVLMECPLLSTQRQYMINAIEIMYVRDNVPAWERQLHLNTLLSPHHSSQHPCRSQNRTLKLSVCNRLHYLHMYHEYVYKRFLNYLFK